MHLIPSGAKLIFHKITQTECMRKAFARRMFLFVLFTAGAAALFSFFCPIDSALSKMFAKNWSDGWIEWKTDSPERAFDSWSRLNAFLPFSERSSKFYYWRVRALEKMGRHDDAAKLASLLALRNPLSFYSFALAYSGRYPALTAIVKDAASRTHYSRKWEKEVNAASAATGLSRNVLWALIRQESKFNAEAVSKNGAVGLMQLMPFTAREAAARLKDESLTPYIPTHNIMLGSAHLMHLKKRFGGSTALAAAAYNAGASAVLRWRGDGTSEWVEWVEDIPYPQTREYLKAVLANIEVYSASSPCREDELSFFSNAEKKNSFSLRRAHFSSQLN